MSTITRTLRNLRKIGLKGYGHQLQYIGDTKAGTYIATDRYGNKYYENLQDELPREIENLTDSRRGRLMVEWHSEDEMGRLQKQRVFAVSSPPSFLAVQPLARALRQPPGLDPVENPAS
jgi:hypothetical protein